jgi:NAD(P)H-dependent nitrite reductase small subunit
MVYVDTTLKAADIPVGGCRSITVEGTAVGLFHQPNGFFAISNLCPHRGAPLDDGFVSDGYVTCPWHQWQFQLSDGVCRNIPNLRIATFPLEVRDGTIWIQPQGNKP